jgi:hypothetical protein
LRPIANAIERPSGDQAGEETSPRSFFSRRAWPPPARITHSSRRRGAGRRFLPLRARGAGARSASRVKASRRPSGDQTGSRSSAPPAVSGRARLRGALT